MKLYAKYKLNCNDIVKDYFQKLIDSEWDYKTDKIFRTSNNESVVALLNNEMNEQYLYFVEANLIIKSFIEIQ
jgi:hypothetical protein